MICGTLWSRLVHRLKWMSGSLIFMRRGDGTAIQATLRSSPSSDDASSPAAYLAAQSFLFAHLTASPNTHRASDGQRRSKLQNDETKVILWLTYSCEYRIQSVVIIRFYCRYREQYIWGEDREIVFRWFWDCCLQPCSMKLDIGYIQMENKRVNSEKKSNCIHCRQSLIFPGLITINSLLKE